jgi:transcriptional regulator with XRE-family HTH domain
MRPEALVDPEALRAARIRAGLTRPELARLVGVAGGERVSRWELGTSSPRPEILHQLARVLASPLRSC